MARPVTKLQDIESTAIRLFARHGLAQVTIKDIAREAQCAEGALYRHYRSKEAMAWSLFKREVEAFVSKVRPVWFQQGTFPEKLKAGIELFYKFFDQDPMAFSFILLAQHDFPTSRKINPDLSPENLVFYFIREGIKAGAFGIRDAELATAMVLGLVLEPAILHAKGKLKGSMTSRVDAITQACLKVLAAKKAIRKRNS